MRPRTRHIVLPSFGHERHSKLPFTSRLLVIASSASLWRVSGSGRPGSGRPDPPRWQHATGVPGLRHVNQGRKGCKKIIPVFLTWCGGGRLKTMPSTRLLRTGPVARRTVAPLSPFRKAAPRIPRQLRVNVNAEHVPDNSVQTPTVSRRDALAAVAAVAASAAIGPRWAVAGESFVLVDASGDPIAFSDWKAMGNPASGAVTDDSVPFALVLNGDGSLKDFALQTNCSLEDCEVDWNEETGCFVCPCCQSRYDRKTGNVLLGPAVNPLPIWKVALNSDNHVVVTEWTGTDFRTGEKAWWL